MGGQGKEGEAGGEGGEDDKEEFEEDLWETLRFYLMCKIVYV